MNSKFKFVVGIIVDPRFEDEDFAVMFRFPKENKNMYDAYRTSVISANSYYEMREKAIAELDKVLDSYKPKMFIARNVEVKECNENELSITEFGGKEKKKTEVKKDLPKSDNELFIDL